MDVSGSSCSYRQFLVHMVHMVHPRRHLPVVIIPCSPEHLIDLILLLIYLDGLLHGHIISLWIALRVGTSTRGLR